MSANCFHLPYIILHLLLSQVIKKLTEVIKKTYMNYNYSTSIVVDQFGAFFKHHRPKSYLPLDIAIPFRFPVHVIVELRCDL